MNQQEVLRILRKVGAVIVDSHIVYTSGLHGTAYVNKDAVYPHTKEISDLCRAIAGQFVDDGVEVVIAPAVGGVILSQWTAHHLSELTGREVLGIYAEREYRERILFEPLVIFFWYVNIVLICREKVFYILTPDISIWRI